MKTFSLDEAQSLLPILESLLRRAIDAKVSAGLVEADHLTTGDEQICLVHEGCSFKLW